MKKNKILVISCIVLIIVSCSKGNQLNTKKMLTSNLVDMVNPYMGNISHLLVPTFPTVHLPHSMLRVIPARLDYTTDRLKGLPVATVSHRGQSAFTMSPIQNKNKKLKPVYSYSYDNENITPYSYDVYLDEEKIQVSYGVSHQSGIYVIDYQGKENNNLIIQSTKGQLSIDEKSISGYQLVSSIESEIATKLYLYLEIDQPSDTFGVLKDGIISNEKTIAGDHIAVVFKLNDATQSLKVKYGISFISEAQAKVNLEREIKNFEKSKTVEKGRKIWNNELSKTLIEGGSENDKIVFYTSMYRTYERPVCISEDGKYYSAFDGKVHDDHGRPFYTDDWIWDSYRAHHPLRVLIDPEREEDIINSFVRMAEQMDHFWMPTFPEVTGDSRRMNSNHGVASVIDAYRKGLRGFDLEKAYQACKGAIIEKTLAPWSGMPSGELDDFYKEKGYFPALHDGEEETVPEVHAFESRQPVAVTLGTSYDEWCLSQIAKELGKHKEYQYFLKNSFNYQNIFNPKTKFFHPKDHQGEFIEPFSYKYSGGMGARKFYGENNAWTYRYDVQHNIKDLINLMGGNEPFIENLNALFIEPLGKSKYEFYAQLPDQTGNVGQFSMANEPSLHIPYLYNYAGQPWKTQKRIKKLVHEWFRNDLMGVPGDEDGGGMSAFVVFSMMGIYPVTPGMPSYNIGSPFFEKTTVDLGHGNHFVIKANNFSSKNKYIQSAKLNGKDWNQPWFEHDAIKHGGTLVLEMGPFANESWGSSITSMPPSAEDMIE